MTTANKEIYYDLETTNQSFKNMAKYLEESGIKNNKFMLIIHDKDLIGVDPRNPNLDLKMKKKILVECMNNIWYYLREVVRVPLQGSLSGTPFRLNRANTAMIFLSILNIDMGVCVSRCNYSTLTTKAIMSYHYLFTPAATESIISKVKENAKYVLYGIKEIINLLPSYLSCLMNSPVVQLSNNNTVENLYDRIKAYPKIRSKDSAIKLARSMTSSIHFLHEFSYQNYTLDFFKEFKKISKEIKDNNLLSGIPNFTIYELFYGSYSDIRIRNSETFIKEYTTKWNDAFYDLAINKFQEDAKNGTIYYIEYTWRELGRSLEWYNEMCLCLKRDREIIATELDLVYTK